MTDQLLVFEASQSNFNTLVTLASYKYPVIVQFMTIWSEPCVLMADNLSGLANEFSGQFVFGKVDIDEQPQLREEYKIVNVPTLKVFKDGKVVHTEEGQMSPDELRSFLKTFGIARLSDELRMQARQMHVSGNTVEAISLLTQAIQQDPSNTRVAMDMVQIFIDVNELGQARSLFNRLPDADKQSNTGRVLIGQLTFRDLASKTEGKEKLQSRIDNNPADNDASFDMAICLVAENQYEQAVEHLFRIIDQSPDYRDGAAREMVITLSNMLMPNDPEIGMSFRRRLANLTH